jgi:hypothetical protein
MFRRKLNQVLVHCIRKHESTATGKLS